MLCIEFFSKVFHFLKVIIKAIFNVSAFIDDSQNQ